MYGVLYKSGVKVMIPSFNSSLNNNQTSRQGTIGKLEVKTFDSIKEAAEFASKNNGIIFKTVEYDITEVEESDE